MRLLQSWITPRFAGSPLKAAHRNSNRMKAYRAKEEARGNRASLCYGICYGLSVYDSRWVVRVILALFAKSLETGQPALALFAACSNFALSAPGIFAVKSR